MVAGILEHATNKDIGDRLTSKETGLFMET